jgi:hypothetical protein
MTGNYRVEPGVQQWLQIYLAQRPGQRPLYTPPNIAFHLPESVVYLNIKRNMARSRLSSMTAKKRFRSAAGRTWATGRTWRNKNQPMSTG